ncbi:MAG: hypothetical protein AABX28_02730 [Nanoarchaeota archaeon]
MDLTRIVIHSSQLKVGRLVREQEIIVKRRVYNKSDITLTTLKIEPCDVGDLPDSNRKRITRTVYQVTPGFFPNLNNINRLIFPEYPLDMIPYVWG